MSDPIKIRLVDDEWDNVGMTNNVGDMYLKMSKNFKLYKWVIIAPHGHVVSDISLSLHKVSGEPPNITVDPSILMRGGARNKEWHGWIKNGVITTV